MEITPGILGEKFKQTALLKEIPDAVLNLLAEKSKIHPVAPEETIIHKNEPGTSLYLIISGEVKVHDKEHTVARLKEGNFFGELALLDDGPRSMSVTAVNPTIVAIIESNVFYEVFRNYPEVIKKIISVLAQRLRSQNEIVVEQLRRREEELTHLVNERTAEVVKQKKLIEEKNKDIIDSITYARRLQQVILPSLSSIKKNLPECFVLYKPKDIVAGDFYWMEVIKENFVFIAAADCTGHGVPGAMVSVVCSNALNRAVKEYKLTETGKILDKVNELVKEVFEKTDNDINDGMDISFLAINKSNGEIKWSGANNRLWYFENGELKEIKGDKQPIGKYINNNPFTTHKISFSGGTSFYLSTDGYADQFGGDGGKKFMSAQMKKVIISIQHENMEKQHDLLNEAFENWRGNLEQVDDVCVIGLKI